MSREARRTQLIEATIETMAARGYSRTTLTEVAQHRRPLAWPRPLPFQDQGEAAGRHAHLSGPGVSPELAGRSCGSQQRPCRAAQRADRGRLQPRDLHSVPGLPPGAPSGARRSRARFIKKPPPPGTPPTTASSRASAPGSLTSATYGRDARQDRPDHPRHDRGRLARPDDDGKPLLAVRKASPPHAPARRCASRHISARTGSRQTGPGPETSPWNIHSICYDPR
jgi:hypothetical protein